MSHHIIDIEAISTLPGEVLTTQVKCSRHPDFIKDFFCNQHHVICCRNCMSEQHRSCDKFMPLEMASKNAKTSSLLHDISDGMTQVHLTLKTAVQNRQENRDRVKIEEKTIVRQISAFKASVIKKLDELEHSALLEMQTVSQDSICQIEREESELEKSVSLIEKHLQQLDFVTKNGSDQHVFLLLHRLLPILSKEDSNLEEMLANLSDVNLDYDHPENLLSGIQSLGTIRLKKTPCTITFKPYKHMEAQNISVQSRPKKSFKFGYSIDRTFDKVSGMVVDKDDNLILADKSLLRMYNKDGKFVKESKLGGNAWDISYHKQSGRIVVALQDSGVQFVDNFIAQTKISIQSITDCRGVTWVEDHVYVCGSDSNDDGRIIILDSNGQHISSISSISSIGRVYYIHHRDNNIYYTDYKQNVYCIKKDESNVLTFSSPDLRKPDGMDTDRQGNAYVVGRGSNNIIRLSPDGQNSDIIIKKEHGISDPLTHCFSKDFKKLFVSNQGGEQVVVYNCEY
jgi:sugar lactone lactonase YvrE